MSKTTQATCSKHEIDYERRQIAGVFLGCPKCEDERAQAWDAAEAERERTEQQTRWAAKLEAAGIPKRFQSKTLDAYVPTVDGQRKALAWARDYAGDFGSTLAAGRSALLIGKPGTGKSHLAIGIALHVLEHGGSARFGTVQQAVRSVKDTWRKGSNLTESEAIAHLTKPDLLILDEVGVQFGTTFEQNLLFDVLNDRYNAMRPTILLSNLDADAVKEFLGERVLDRMREDGGRVLAFDWASYRAGGASC